MHKLNEWSLMFVSFINDDQTKFFSRCYVHQICQDVFVFKGCMWLLSVNFFWNNYHQCISFNAIVYLGHCVSFLEVIEVKHFFRLYMYDRLVAQPTRVILRINIAEVICLLHCHFRIAVKDWSTFTPTPLLSPVDSIWHTMSMKEVWVFESASSNAIL